MRSVAALIERPRPTRSLGVQILGRTSEGEAI